MRNKILRGVKVAEGIEIGSIIIYPGYENEVLPFYILREPDKQAEIRRLSTAIDDVKQELKALQSIFEKENDPYSARIFEVSYALLEEPWLLEGAQKIIENESRNAEYALQKVIAHKLRMFEQASSVAVRQRGVLLEEVARKILKKLMGKDDTLASIPEGKILVAPFLSTFEVAQIPRNKIKGLALSHGGMTSHLAILAQTFDIPVVVGIRDLMRHVRDGQLAILDGYKGLIILEPDESTLRTYEAKIKHYSQLHDKLVDVKDLPPVTIDGRNIELCANINLPAEVNPAIEFNAEGIGLLRTEFIFLEDMLDEEQQFKIYSDIADKIYPGSVIIRTFDIGADKLAPYVREDNPFLGWRAIRLLLKEKKLLRTQLRAILRASRRGNVKIMIPMVTTVEEVLEVKKLLNKIKRDLRNENVEFDENIDIGVMIETPASAIMAEVLAKEVRFFSIGTNDLTQYTMAVDRNNPYVSELYDPLHPALLRLVKNVIIAGHAAHSWVGVCGEMAHDPMAIPILIGLGVDELSVAPRFLLKTKEIIRHLSYKETKAIAEKVLDMRNAAEVRRFMKNVLKEEFHLDSVIDLDSP